MRIYAWLLIFFHLSFFSFLHHCYYYFFLQFSKCFLCKVYMRPDEMLIFPQIVINSSSIKCYLAHFSGSEKSHQQKANTATIKKNFHAKISRIFFISRQILIWATTETYFWLGSTLSFLYKEKSVENEEERKEI